MTYEASGALIAFAAALLPLIAAAACATPVTRRIAPLLSAAAALPALLAGVFAPDGSAALTWLGTGAHVVLDPTSRTFLLLTAFIWVAAGTYAYATVHHRRERFFGFFALAMAGNLALTVTSDPATFYTLFSLMALSTYALVTHPAEETFESGMRAGRVYLSFTVVGEAVLLSGFFLLAAGGVEHIVGATVLILLAFGIKVGTPGLHGWMPIAYAAAPPAAAAALSGAMSTSGVLGVIRFVPGTESIPASIGVAVMALGLLAAFGGVLAGVAQRVPAVVLAYSSVSQFGLMTVAVGAGLTSSEAWPVAVSAVTIYAVHHGLAKAALFLGGDIAARTARRGWVIVGLALPALALAGLPLTSGAVAKIALKSSTAFAPGAWLRVLEIALPLAAAGTTVLVVRFCYLAWSSRRSVATTQLSEGAPTKTPSRPVIAFAAWAALLAGVAAALWVWPAEGVAYAAKTSLTSAYVWLATWPVLLGVALASTAWAARATVGRIAGTIPPGDVWAPVFSAAHKFVEARDVSTTRPDAGKVATESRFPTRAFAGALLEAVGRAEAGLLVWAVAMLTAGVLTLLVLLMAFMR
ncbi:MAG: hypothetical protein KGZ40_05380 [Clostridiales bacterium]|nr:hypothetical protein [Clostridiales bacterium]